MANKSQNEIPKKYQTKSYESLPEGLKALADKIFNQTAKQDIVERIRQYEVTVIVKTPHFAKSISEVCNQSDQSRTVEKLHRSLEKTLFYYYGYVPSDAEFDVETRML